MRLNAAAALNVEPGGRGHLGARTRAPTRTPPLKGRGDHAASLCRTVRNSIFFSYGAPRISRFT